MKRYKIIVCKTKTCRERFSRDTFQELEKLIKRQSLQDRIILGEGGCFGYCDEGPNVLVLGPIPDEKWQHFQKEDESIEDLSVPSQFFHGVMPSDCSEILKKLL